MVTQLFQISLHDLRIKMNKTQSLILKYSSDCLVFEPGVFVSKHNSRLKYSADSVIFKSGVSIKLEEIKCPFLGKYL